MFGLKWPSRDAEISKWMRNKVISKKIFSVGHPIYRVSQNHQPLKIKVFKIFRFFEKILTPLFAFYAFLGQKSGITHKTKCVANRILLYFEYSKVSWNWVLAKLGVSTCSLIGKHQLFIFCIDLGSLNKWFFASNDFLGFQKRLMQIFIATEKFANAVANSHPPINFEVAKGEI